MRLKPKASHLILAALLLWALPSAALAADVDVFAEGVYSFNKTSPAESGKLVVYIYANINTDPLCSYGVALNYASAKLGSPVAEKNTAIWYMGASSPGNSYMDPDTSTPGKVIFIGGKLDTANPTAGVTGPRVLLGKVSFTRLDNVDPKTDASGVAHYFGIGLTLGKAAPYENFVTVGGVKKDANISAAWTIWQAGDANADGVVNVQDIAAVRYYMTNGGTPNLWKDCNGDGVINVQDIACIRYIMTH